MFKIVIDIINHESGYCRGCISCGFHFYDKSGALKKAVFRMKMETGYTPLMLYPIHTSTINAAMHQMEKRQVLSLFV